MTQHFLHFQLAQGYNVICSDQTTGYTPYTPQYSPGYKLVSSFLSLSHFDTNFKISSKFLIYLNFRGGGGEPQENLKRSKYGTFSSWDFIA